MHEGSIDLSFVVAPTTVLRDRGSGGDVVVVVVVVLVHVHVFVVVVVVAAVVVDIVGGSDGRRLERWSCRWLTGGVAWNVARRLRFLGSRPSRDQRSIPRSLGGRERLERQRPIGWNRGVFLLCRMHRAGLGCRYRGLGSGQGRAALPWLWVGGASGARGRRSGGPVESGKSSSADAFRSASLLVADPRL